MYKNLVDYITAKHLAVWIVFIIDTFVVFTAYILALILRHNFDWSSLEDYSNLWLHAAITTLVYGLAFLTLKSYRAMVRHSSLPDLQKLIIACLWACVGLTSLSYCAFEYFDYQGILLIPKSALIIQFLLASFFLTTLRVAIKSAYATFINNYSKLKKRVIIYGTGETALAIKNSIGEGGRIKIFGFLSDNGLSTGKHLNGLPIFSAAKALDTNFMKNFRIDQVIISNEISDHIIRKQIIEYSLSNGIEVKEVPPHSKWINGELTHRQIRPVKIEDLLGRGQINLDSVNVARELQDKVILVTGGAGSIGSEIVRQCLHYAPYKVIMLDQAESPCHDLEVMLNADIPELAQKLEVVIGDITNQSRMQHIFDVYKPDVIFHAAAYKHVPLMELNPIEAIQTNIFGTQIIADLAKSHGVEKFVMVSTDKAINPTNVMGTTKRIAEMYTQLLDSQCDTQFIITRFGNVLGSNGSVIPLFKRQIEKGGPLTITHKDITRYFMTIAEACDLVLEAGAMGNGGEIFVFDMGKPVRIYELAQKMISLSGLKEGRDIEIKVTGLRPGEKLYEELLANEENTIATHHDKIMKARIKPVYSSTLIPHLNLLQLKLVSGDKNGLVNTLKDLVPEYISNNSEFSKLDDQRSKVAS